MEKKLSILIILYEENFEIIQKCLSQLSEFKVIIIDNANDQSLRDKIIKNFRIYKYFLNKKNIGFSKAANQGILECDTEYLFLLGADCLITNQDIKELILAKEKYKDCFLTSPTFYDSNGNFDYNGGPLYEDGPKNKPLKNSGDVCVNAVLTTAVLFKIKDIKSIGLFDEEFFLYFLDDDLCKRIKNTNKSIVQVYNARATHTHGQLKIKNRLKKIFFRNFYFDYEELYYLYKNNIHHEKYNNVKKKVPKFLFKLILNFLIFRFGKFTYYLSKLLAFKKFTKFIK